MYVAYMRVKTDLYPPPRPYLPPPTQRTHKTLNCSPIYIKYRVFTVHAYLPPPSYKIIQGL